MQRDDDNNHNKSNGNLEDCKAPALSLPWASNSNDEAPNQAPQPNEKGTTVILPPRDDPEVMVGAIRMVGNQIDTTTESADDMQPDGEAGVEGVEEAAEQGIENIPDTNNTTAGAEEEPVLIQAHLVEDATVEAQNSTQPFEIENVVMDETVARPTSLHPSEAPLVEASPLEHSKPMSIPAMLRSNPKLGLFVLMLILLTIGVTLGIVYGIDYDTSSEEEVDNSVGSTRETFVRDVLPDYTQKALEDPESDQSLALDWLWEDPEATANLPLFRRLQRFVMATAYYAALGYENDMTGRPGWWLSPIHECEWPQRVSPSVACREGRFNVINMRGDTNINGTLPPENWTHDRSVSCRSVHNESSRVDSDDDWAHD